MERRRVRVIRRSLCWRNVRRHRKLMLSRLVQNPCPALNRNQQCRAITRCTLSLRSAGHCRSHPADSNPDRPLRCLGHSLARFGDKIQRQEHLGPRELPVHQALTICSRRGRKSFRGRWRGNSPGECPNATSQKMRSKGVVKMQSERRKKRTKWRSRWVHIDISMHYKDPSWRSQRWVAWEKIIQLPAVECVVPHNLHRLNQNWLYPFGFAHVISVFASAMQRWQFYHVKVWITARCSWKLFEENLTIG